MKKLFGFLIAAIMVLTLGAGAASAGVGSEIPDNGKHYQLNIIGVAKGKTADMSNPDRRTVFVNLGKNDAITTKINVMANTANPTQFEVIDGNGTDGEATIAVPYTTYGTLSYNVYAIALGKPGGSVHVDAEVTFDDNTTAGLLMTSFDLARGKDIQARLASLADELERGAYIPDSLKGLVRVGEAKQRWAALKQFSLKHGHFLVTNGPYRLETWGGDSVVLQVFRDLSYPLGVGSFDRHALPSRAFVSKVEERRDSLRISAEIEKPVRVQRTYTTVREPLTSASEVGAYRVEPVSRYVAVSLDGTVRTAGTAPMADDRTFALDLQGLTPGQYTILIAIYPNGNQVNPEVKTIPYRVER